MHNKFTHSGFIRGMAERIEMSLLGMDTSFGYQTHEMQSNAGNARGFKGSLQGGFLFERPVSNSAIDAQQILIHNAPSPNVHVAHFAIAHLPFRQSNVFAVRPQGGIRCATQQTIHEWSVGGRDGIGIVLVSDAPSVEDDQRALGDVG